MARSAFNNGLLGIDVTRKAEKRIVPSKSGVTVERVKSADLSKMDVPAEKAVIKDVEKSLRVEKTVSKQQIVRKDRQADFEFDEFSAEYESGDELS